MRGGCAGYLHFGAGAADGCKFAVRAVAEITQRRRKGRSREYFEQQVTHGLGIIHNGEDALDQRLWIYALHSEAAEWDTAMRGIVAHMIKSDIFDKRMISLLKRVRCKNNVDEPECAPTVPQQQLK